MSATQYRARIVNIDVHKWDDTNGEGDYVCCKGGFTIGYADSIADVKQIISDWFDYPVDDECIVEDGTYISMSQIEDIDAYATPKGDYIAEYLIIVEEIRHVNLLEEK